ncbi:hypothetical protein RND81_09G153700 [Saponaria officinalis]|uniref:Choline transporter-like protein n=1 Tax=Saponaria officinalis TaxID=3572 RepID=A0AAW1IN58_SAPOF
MASPEEPTNLNESSSSPTQPLLSKSYPSPSIDEHLLHSQQSDIDPTQFPQISYNYNPRPFKDLTFLILFLLLCLSTFVFGIFSIANKNPNFSSLSSFSFDPKSSSCVKNSSFNHGAVLNFNGFFLNFDGFSNLNSNNASFVEGVVWVLLITFILSLPMIWGVLLLLKHYTKQIVYVCLPFFIVIPFGVNVYWFVACTLSSSCSDALPLAYRILLMIFVFLVIGVLVWIFMLNWHRIELTINIIGVASDALSRNLGLFGVVPCLKLGLVVFYVPIVVFLVFARFNGKIVGRDHKGVYHCEWKQDSWVPAYYALAILTMLWSATVMFELKAYVTSATIAQWYFSNDDATPKRKIRSSLRNAFGPSAGTICFSGLLVCIVRMVRAAVDSARREDNSGIVNVVLQCMVRVFLAAIDFMNKFTINFAAITGEAYCASARMTYELLRRNLMSPVFVETISSRLLAGIIFVLSAVYAVVVCAILNGVTNLGVTSYWVALLAWLLLIVMLGFFAHLLDNVIDTIYVCYAIDRDRADVSKPDIHHVYVQLPISRSARTPLNV